MIDQRKLSAFWESDVPEEYKHFSGTPFDKKVRKYEEDIRARLLEHVDFNEVKIALDWGCGGGLGARLLTDHCGVIVLDIAESSLQQCEEYLQRYGKQAAAKVLLENLEELAITTEVDLLFSASVVQHFPSYEYWKRVVSYWKSLAPKWVAVQTRHGDENKSNEKAYFDGTKNYILGLYLTTDEVVESLGEKYNLVYHHLEDDGYSMYEYFVFRQI